MLPPYTGRRKKFTLELPFSLIPGVSLPPTPRPAPRPRSRHHFAAHPLQINSRRLPVFHLYTHSLSRSHHAKRRHSRARVRMSFNFRLALSALSVLLNRNNEPRHPKTLRPVAIHQFRATQIPFPYQLLQTSNRHF